MLGDVGMGRLDVACSCEWASGGLQIRSPKALRSDCLSEQFAERAFASCRLCLYLSSPLSSPSLWTQMEQEMPLSAASCPSCWLARTTTSAVVPATTQPMSSSRDQAAHSRRSPQALSGTENHKSWQLLSRESSTAILVVFRIG